VVGGRKHGLNAVESTGNLGGGKNASDQEVGRESGQNKRGEAGVRGIRKRNQKGVKAAR